MVTLRIVNLTRNSVLATGALVAKSISAKRVGLLGHAPLQQGEGMFFPECSAIHTEGMTFDIDVLFLDMLTRRVIKTVQNVNPGNRLSARIPREIGSVIELPAGAIQLTGTRCGDVIVIMSSGHASQADLNQVGRW